MNCNSFAVRRLKLEHGFIRSLRRWDGQDRALSMIQWKNLEMNQSAACHSAP